MSAAHTTFYYDGDCGMCVAFVRRVARFDRRGRVVWTPYQSLLDTPSPSTGEGWDGGEPPRLPHAPPPGVTLDDMDRAAYTISPDGAVSEGFYAIRALLKAIPALAPLGLLMSIPGVSLVGRPAYRLVANNRRRISQSCRIQPKDSN